ncbi:DUF1883 domain-containing protein [Salipaludibacillus aurantiacus]|uniref:DUF1883 domain-containing protein n=1 Tax=Salipaludibacillus aurantiacus TaxID=1601833 RepID=A0A1H9W677_9BACI|nr:DUF1883 domain-containing protein [Salipaludibacillus aurantiacus]SES28973.1 protein of unknown function [Salipaludibacillus aurantiacus]
MKYKVLQKYLDYGDMVSVELNRQAYVLLLDATNYERFKKGRHYQKYGGLAKSSPFKISVPSTGEWFVVLHLGKDEGNLKYNIVFM